MLVVIEIEEGSRSQSNMNRLCWDIEKWHRKIRFKRKYDDFDYSIMLDDSIPFDEDKFNQLENYFRI